MAKVDPATRRVRRATAPGQPVKAGGQDPFGVIHGPVFTRKNYVWLGIALGVIVVGFVALAAGDITFAPILLVAGYLVLVPIAILKR